MKKFRKKFKPRDVKSHRTYSVKEIVELFNVHPNTVGAWIKSGLKTIDKQRPALVFWQDLRDFIKRKNESKKHPCAEDQFFCFKCQKPRQSKDYKVTVKEDNCRTNLVGICATCRAEMNKTISPKKLNYYHKIFKIEVVQEEDLIGCVNTCGISDKKKGIKNG